MKTKTIMNHPSLFFPLALLLCLSCNSEPTSESGTGAERTGTTDTSPALPENFVRTDGIYHSSFGKVQYYMRFYPDGNVILAGGMADSKPTVPELIDAARMKPVPNVHSVFCRIEGDSILFVTQALKGQIDYHGHRDSPEQLSFKKVSHINGRQMELVYAFEPF
ncbi:MAG: hypothetical protein KDB88_10200 [Flavobacteriales bacterium]|nr:hypothetical protein [Flavobacteriales bacterium]